MWPFAKNQVPVAPPVSARVEPILNAVDSSQVKSGDPRVLDLFGLNQFAAGVAVNEKSAMQLSAVHGCVRVISSAFAVLPLHLYKDGPNGRERDREHPLRKLLNLQPNPRFTSAAFRKFSAKANLLRGDAFIEIVRSRFNEVLGFKPHHPDATIVEREGERLMYYVSDDGKYRGVQQEDMIHVPGLGFNGVRSESVVSHYARNTLGGALAAERHSSDFFEHGAMQRFAITMQRSMTPEDQRAFRDQWAETYGGRDKAARPLVLTSGAELKELTLSAQDAQLLESRNYNVSDICRFFGVPPHMVGHTEKSTSWGSGIEQMSIAFVVYCLQPFLVDFEQELNRKLFPNEERFFEFETRGLLRGDSKSQAEFFKAALGGSGGPGWMKPNEVRALNNMSPVNGGETLVQWSQVGGSSRSAPGENEEASSND